MIPYEDLCRALDQYNAVRNNAAEMAQLDSVEEAPAPSEPVYQEAPTEPEPVFQDVPEEPVYQEAPEEPVYQDVPDEVIATQEDLRETVPAEAPQEFAPQETSPQMEPVTHDSAPMEPVQADASPLEEPTLQAPIDLGMTAQQVFTPGAEAPLDAGANTAETAMPYLEEPTDVTPLEAVPEDVPSPGPEETTLEFDIEEAEEIKE